MIIEILKTIIIGIVEGITEWLPVSSTGHMILVEEFIKLKASEAFIEMFNAASNENLGLVINSAYRSYQDQTDTCDLYRNYYDLEVKCKEDNPTIGLLLVTEQDTLVAKYSSIFISITT